MLIILRLPMQELRLQKHSITYGELLARVSAWDIPARLAEKYPSWHFRPPMPQPAPAWLQLAHNSLLYYLLKSFEWLLSDSSPGLLLIHSYHLKQSYNCLRISRHEDFHFRLILIVKLTAYFLAAHFPQLQTDLSLQQEIYQLLTRNLLGIAVEARSYRLLLRSYKSKKEIKKERESMDMATKENWRSELPKAKGMRRHAKDQTTLFIGPPAVESNPLQDLKIQLRESLYVRPCPKKIVGKIALKQVIGQPQPCSHPNRHGKYIIQSNQLSNALQLHDELKLSDVKTFSIHCTPARDSKTTELNPHLPRTAPHEPTLQPTQQPKNTKNWVKIVTEMKEELYVHRLRKSQPDPTCEQQTAPIVRERQPTSNPLPFIIQSSPTQQELVKFRKLDLLNSPNIEYYEESQYDSYDEGTFQTLKVTEGKTTDKIKQYSKSKMSIKNKGVSLQQMKSRKCKFQLNCMQRQQGLSSVVCLPQIRSIV